MSPLPLLTDLVFVFAASVAVGLVSGRLRQPVTAGFILAGTVIGPHGLGLVGDVHAVEILAEIGVVLLLFTIGVELPLARLVEMRGLLLGAGGAQVALTLAVSALVARALGLGWGQALAVGFFMAMSSTALVLKALVDRGEIDAPHGRICLGILLFQDLLVVPLMLLLPFLSGVSGNLLDLPLALGKSILLVLVILVVARRGVPFLLAQIVAARSRDVFLLSVILICLATAMLAHQVGLSLAVGAFVAGLAVSESEYAHQALADILPLRDGFLPLFFVSVGMLIDLPHLGRHLGLVLALVAAVTGGKALAAAGAVLLTGASARVAIQAAVTLAQIGEFSFILLAAAERLGILTGEPYQVLLAVAALSMLFTPFLTTLAPRVGAALSGVSALRRLEGRGLAELRADEASLKHLDAHVVIVGYGLNGRNLSRVLRQSGVPYVVLELNPDTVRRGRSQGEPLYYGDAASPEVLRHLGLDRAKVLVLAISDPASTRRALRLAREIHPGLHIVARTRYLAEIAPLYELGADEVIPEEFETSIEIFSRVLHCYRVPEEVIVNLARQVRSERYELLRDLPRARPRLADLRLLLGAVEVETHRLTDKSHGVGLSLGELRLRAASGATVVGLVREGKLEPNPRPDRTLQANDVVLLVGRAEERERAVSLLEKGVLPQPAAG
jgi:CPA2 family monovalent cation:H+ antiporter-2